MDFPTKKNRIIFDEVLIFMKSLALIEMNLVCHVYHNMIIINDTVYYIIVHEPHATNIPK